jgi:hypothetical protein
VTLITSFLTRDVNHVPPNVVARHIPRPAMAPLHSTQFHQAPDERLSKQEMTLSKSECECTTAVLTDEQPEIVSGAGLAIDPALVPRCAGGALIVRPKLPFVAI